MDKNNDSVLRKFQCEKKVIIEGMSYFKQHLKDADQFNTIDIQVQCDPKIFEILYEFAERAVNLRLNLDMNERKLAMVLKPYNIL